jgi:hypothetical protein
MFLSEEEYEYECAVIDVQIEVSAEDIVSECF